MHFWIHSPVQDKIRSEQARLREFQTNYRDTPRRRILRWLGRGLLIGGGLYAGWRYLVSRGYDQMLVRNLSRWSIDIARQNPEVRRESPIIQAGFAIRTFGSRLRRSMTARYLQDRLVFDYQTFLARHKELFGDEESYKSTLDFINQKIVPELFRTRTRVEHLVEFGETPYPSHIEMLRYATPFSFLYTHLTERGLSGEQIDRVIESLGLGIQSALDRVLSGEVSLYSDEVDKFVRERFVQELQSGKLDRHPLAKHLEGRGWKPTTLLEAINAGMMVSDPELAKAFSTVSPEHYSYLDVFTPLRELPIQAQEAIQKYARRIQSVPPEDRESIHRQIDEDPELSLGRFLMMRERYRARILSQIHNLAPHLEPVKYRYEPDSGDITSITVKPEVVDFLKQVPYHYMMRDPESNRLVDLGYIAPALHSSVTDPASLFGIPVAPGMFSIQPLRMFPWFRPFRDWFLHMESTSHQPVINQAEGRPTDHPLGTDYFMMGDQLFKIHFGYLFPKSDADEGADLNSSLYAQAVGAFHEQVSGSWAGVRVLGMTMRGIVESFIRSAPQRDEGEPDNRPAWMRALHLGAQGEPSWLGKFYRGLFPEENDPRSIVDRFLDMSPEDMLHLSYEDRLKIAHVMRRVAFQSNFDEVELLRQFVGNLKAKSDLRADDQLNEWIDLLSHVADMAGDKTGWEAEAAIHGEILRGGSRLSWLIGVLTDPEHASAEARDYAASLGIYRESLLSPRLNFESSELANLSGLGTYLYSYLGERYTPDRPEHLLEPVPGTLFGVPDKKLRVSELVRALMLESYLRGLRNHPDIANQMEEAMIRAIAQVDNPEASAWFMSSVIRSIASLPDPSGELPKGTDPGDVTYPTERLLRVRDSLSNPWSEDYARVAGGFLDHLEWLMRWHHVHDPVELGDPQDPIGHVFVVRQGPRMFSRKWFELLLTGGAGDWLAGRQEAGVSTSDLYPIFIGHRLNEMLKPYGLGLEQEDATGGVKVIGNILFYRVLPAAGAYMAWRYLNTEFRHVFGYSPADLAADVARETQVFLTRAMDITGITATKKWLVSEIPGLELYFHPRSAEELEWYYRYGSSVVRYGRGWLSGSRSLLAGEGVQANLPTWYRSIRGDWQAASNADIASLGAYRRGDIPIPTPRNPIAPIIWLLRRLSGESAISFAERHRRDRPYPSREDISALSEGSGAGGTGGGWGIPVPILLRGFGRVPRLREELFALPIDQPRVPSDGSDRQAAVAEALLPTRIRTDSDARFVIGGAPAERHPSVIRKVALAILAQAEGLVSGLTFGLWRPNFGVDRMAQEEEVSHRFVSAMRFVGSAYSMAIGTPLAPVVRFGAGMAKAEQAVLEGGEALLKAKPDVVTRGFFRIARGKTGIEMEPLRWGYDWLWKGHSYNLFHTGYHPRFGYHFGLGWTSKGMQQGNEFLHFTKWHLYPGRTGSEGLGARIVYFDRSGKMHDIPLKWLEGIDWDKAVKWERAARLLRIPAGWYEYEPGTLYQTGDRSDAGFVPSGADSASVSRRFGRTPQLRGEPIPTGGGPVRVPVSIKGHSIVPIGSLGKRFQDIQGIYGWMQGVTYDVLVGRDTEFRIDDPGWATSLSRRFWETIYGGLDVLPWSNELNELLRRFIPRRAVSDALYFNPIPNNMPPWIPERFRYGDPYTRIYAGEVRLPGEAYRWVNPARFEARRFQSRVRDTDLVRVPIDVVAADDSVRLAFATGAQRALGWDLSIPADARHRVIRALEQELEGASVARYLRISSVRTGVDAATDLVAVDDRGRTQLKVIVSNAAWQPELRRGLEYGLQARMRMFGAREAELVVADDEGDILQRYTVRYNRRALMEYSRQLQAWQRQRERIFDLIEQGTLHEGLFYSPLQRLEVLADIAPRSPQYRQTLAQVRRMWDFLSEEEVARAQTAMDVAKRTSGHQYFPYRNIHLQRTRTRVLGITPEGDILVEGLDRPIRLAGVALRFGAITESMGLPSQARELALQRLYRQLGIIPGHRIEVQTFNPFGSPGRGRQPAVVRTRRFNVNEWLINRGLARADEDDKSREAQSLRQGIFRRLWNFVTDTLTHLDTPIHTKLLRVRSPLEQWERAHVFGTPGGRWEAPIRSYVVPTLQALANRGPIGAAIGGALFGALFGYTTGAKQQMMAAGALVGAGLSLARMIVMGGGPYIPGRVRRRFEIDEYIQALQYVKFMRLYRLEAEKAKRLEGVDLDSWLYQISDRVRALELRRRALQRELTRLRAAQMKRQTKRQAAQIERLEREIAQVEGRIREAGFDPESLRELRLDRDRTRSLFRRLRDRIRARRRGLAEEITRTIPSFGQLPPHARAALAYRYLAENTAPALTPESSLSQLLRTVNPQVRDIYREIVESGDWREKRRFYELIPDYHRYLLHHWLAPDLPLPRRHDPRRLFRKYGLPSEDWKGWDPSVDLELLRGQLYSKYGVDPTEGGVYPAEMAISSAIFDQVGMPVPQRADVDARWTELIGHGGWQSLGGGTVRGLVGRFYAIMDYYDKEYERNVYADVLRSFQ